MSEKYYVYLNLGMATITTLVKDVRIMLTYEITKCQSFLKFKTQGFGLLKTKWEESGRENSKWPHY